MHFVEKNYCKKTRIEKITFILIVAMCIMCSLGISASYASGLSPSAYIAGQNYTSCGSSEWDYYN